MVRSTAARRRVPASTQWCSQASPCGRPSAGSTDVRSLAVPAANDTAAPRTDPPQPEAGRRGVAAPTEAAAIRTPAVQGTQPPPLPREKQVPSVHESALPAPTAYAAALELPVHVGVLPAWHH